MVSDGKRESDCNLGGSANIRNASQAGIFTSQVEASVGLQILIVGQSHANSATLVLLLGLMNWHYKCPWEMESPSVSPKGPDIYVEAHESAYAGEQP